MSWINILVSMPAAKDAEGPGVDAATHISHQGFWQTLHLNTNQYNALQS